MVTLYVRILRPFILRPPPSCTCKPFLYIANALATTTARRPSSPGQGGELALSTRPAFGTFGAFGTGRTLPIAGIMWTPPGDTA